MSFLPAALTDGNSTLRAVVRRVDDRALGWMASTDHGRLRPAFQAAARGIKLLVPWILVSTRLVADGTPASRRAAARGWIAMAMAAAIEGGVVKPMTNRGRPDPRRLPPGKRRNSDPSTSSFPSGHTGAATAFAIATAADRPGLKPALIATAVVVAYTQVYTGRHYASDAVAGFAAGAVAGGLARRLPVPPSR